MRNRQHWNSAQIKPVDPVTLGLATQLELDAVVKKAAEKKAKDDAKRGITEPAGATLRPAAETGAVVEAVAEPEDELEPDVDLDAVFADADADDDED